MSLAFPLLVLFSLVFLALLVVAGVVLAMVATSVGLTLRHAHQPDRSPQTTVRPARRASPLSYMDPVNDPVLGWQQVVGQEDLVH